MNWKYNELFSCLHTNTHTKQLKTFKSYLNLYIKSHYLLVVNFFPITFEMMLKNENIEVELSKVEEKVGDFFCVCIVVIAFRKKILLQIFELVCGILVFYSIFWLQFSPLVVIKNPTSCGQLRKTDKDEEYS